MLLAFGSEGFQKILADHDEEETTSAFIDLNVAFVHFIVLQITSIILAMISKAYYFSLPEGSFLIEYLNLIILFSIPWYFLGFLVFVYAIVSAFAATFAILRVMKMYQVYLNTED